MQPVRFGVLGARSFIFRAAVQGALAEADAAELTAVAAATGPVPDDLRHLDAGSYDAVIDHPDVEAVYLPLPNGAHRYWTERAAAAGKHVLCEKPLAPTADAAAAMAAACTESGVLLAEAWMTPFQRRWRQSIGLARNGALGDVRHVRTEFTFPLPAGENYRWDPADGGGALLDVGIYALGPAVTLWGPDPDHVAATVARSERGVDLTTSIEVGWEDGRSASALCSFELPERQLLEVAGTAGRLVLDGDAHTGGMRATEIVLYDDDGEQHTMTTDGGAPYRGMVEAFGRAVRGAEPWPRPVAEALHLARLLDRIAGAAR
ncbi:MAG: Gfo/Idh/MocA family oxidoreductase [Actinomycetota bacterium]